jgi:acetyltransferase-like isoleucine patch superfamily enzyme
MDKISFKSLFLEMMDNQDNRFHPLVWINGEPEIGKGTYIGGMSEINAKGARVVIGQNCDIASFVAINCADSHRKAIGLSGSNDCRDITLGNNVFVGSHSVIMGGVTIGHNCVVGAGTIVKPAKIPDFSLIVGNPVVVKPGYFKDEWEAVHGQNQSTT